MKSRFKRKWRWQPGKIPAEEKQAPTGKAVLEIKVVRDPEEIQRFTQCMVEHHYLGATRPVGDFLRQVVIEDGQWVGLLAWGSACYRIKDREAWIGWSNTQRAERQKLVVQNRRFLLLHPAGSRPNLGSQVLALATRELPAAWEQQFGYRPVLAETFTDIEAYAGTCYKAAGWIEVGQSAGFSRHRAEFYVKNDRPKKLWLKPLQADARQVLCALELEPAQRKGGKASAHGQLPINAEQQKSLVEALGQLRDGRADNRRFPLVSVLAIVAMAMLTGTRQINEFYRFGLRLTQAQRKRLGLPIKKGTCVHNAPCYNVYYQVLKRVKPDELAAVLNRWLAAQQGSLPAALALDGKMIGDLVGVVSLVEHATGVPVAMAPMRQKEASDGQGELKTAERLLGSQPLDGKLITTDALHTQKETAQTVVCQGGDYLFQIKGNQKKLLEFARQQTDSLPTAFALSEKGHGRQEFRQISLAPVNSESANFPHAQTIIRLSNQCSPKRNPDQPVTRYFVCSLVPEQQSPQQWMQSIRGHWAGVENRNHWRKDACLMEDATRSKNPCIVANLILLRNALFKLFAEFCQDNLSLPAAVEALRCNPSVALNLISKKL